jgi:hypothetical protein
MQSVKAHTFRQFLALAILAIFSLAITPWSALHQHNEHIEVVEENCTHKVHVKASAEHCLVCKAHFEKSYTTEIYNYVIHLKVQLVKRIFQAISGSYTALISTQLRGPPAFS